MLKRALYIGLSVYLVIGISGLAPVVSEAFASEHGDCCSDCEDPGCPEQHGEECPPQCDDCVCPCWVAPLIAAEPVLVLIAPTAREVRYVSGDLTPEPPVTRGVFRPPRLLS